MKLVLLLLLACFFKRLETASDWYGKLTFQKFLIMPQVTLSPYGYISILGLYQPARTYS